jgi:hypothetical protein
VQEVAYASLSTRAPKAPRGRGAEEIYRSRRKGRTGFARHLGGREPEKAVDYLLKAGDAARAVYADREALEHYREARRFLAHLGDERRARDTLFKMALAYHLAFDFEKAEEMYDEAFSCRVGEDPRLPTTERLETASGRPGVLSPGEVYSTEAGYFAELLFRGLLMVDSELNVVPAMADNFRVSADGLTYLFRIKEDARWSDGEPLTAEDYAYAWRRMREQGTRTAFLMEDVETAEALDDRTLECTVRAASYFPTSSARRGPSRGRATPRRSATTGRSREPRRQRPYMLVSSTTTTRCCANPLSGAHGNVGGSTSPSQGRADGPGLAEGKFDLLHVYDPVSMRSRTRWATSSRSSVSSTSGFTDHSFSNQRAQGVPHAVDREALLNTFPTLSRAATRERSRRQCPPPTGSAPSTTDRARELRCGAAIPAARLPGSTRRPALAVPVCEIAELWNRSARG